MLGRKPGEAGRDGSVVDVTYDDLVCISFPEVGRAGIVSGLIP